MELSVRNIVQAAFLSNLDILPLETGQEAFYAEFLKNFADAEPLNLNSLRQKIREPQDEQLTAFEFALVAGAAAVRSCEKQTTASDRKITLDDRVGSIFNNLNGNHEKRFLPLQFLDGKAQLKIASCAALNEEQVDAKSYYHELAERLQRVFVHYGKHNENTHFLLAGLESLLSYIPAYASSEAKERPASSYYEYHKLLAACASVYAAWLDGKDFAAYKNFSLSYDRWLELFTSEDVFLLYSMDLSGIQKFIYTITSKGALKSLRARSFYLEILVEHVIDELLERLHLSRANLIYSGGGHCYLLLPNLPAAKEIIADVERSLNAWFIENFDIALYAACAYVPCSVASLSDSPQGAYAKLYKDLSELLSLKKVRRYGAAEINALNSFSGDRYRECPICHSSRHLVRGGECVVCAALKDFSKHIIQDDFFVVTDNTGKTQDSYLPLPFNAQLLAADEDKTLEWSAKGQARRVYTKNRLHQGYFAAIRLWTGDHQTESLLNEYVADAVGIKRLGIFRADVDSLGLTFAQGFNQSKGQVSLLKTAALSKQLSLFFKFYLNQMLDCGQSAIFSEHKNRRLSVIYSGGDDLFWLGAWNDVIEAALDLQQSFSVFTRGTLTLSGAIGLYRHNYPINVMAARTEDLVDCSKALEGKNGITLLEGQFCYKWNDFIADVLKDKYLLIRDYLSLNPLGPHKAELGHSFLYKLIDLLRGSSEKINKARFIYLLSRLEPQSKDQEADANGQGQELVRAYKHFASNMYDFYRECKAINALICAIYLYLYVTRDTDKQNTGDDYGL